MVIALAGFVTVGAPTAAAGPTGTLQYVALGDSYAAGIGAPPYVSSSFSDRCLQSNKGYPALLDPKGRIDFLVNATCPGATTNDVTAILDSPQNPLSREIRLVTLTVGGNDLGFGPDLFETCSTPGQEPQCLIAISNAVKQLTDLSINLSVLLGDVADAAPEALIVVTGYPYLFEPDPRNPIVTAFNAATAALNTTIEAAVNATRKDTGANIVYVDVTEQFEGHGIGTLDDPFINGPSADFPEAFHPNPAGYRAYAKAISAAIRDRQKQLA
jgi:lysophospholipase L1-like esterase